MTYLLSIEIAERNLHSAIPRFSLGVSKDNYAPNFLHAERLSRIGRQMAALF